MRCRIGITLGDQAGIGPEIVRAALASARLPETAEYFVIDQPVVCSLGQPTRETARAALNGLEEAVARARRGEIQAVVTGPIHKARMYEIGFGFPGQTEFFANRCGVKNFAMLLTGGRLTVALVTAHLPLREVAGKLHKSEIVRVGLLLKIIQISRIRSRGATSRDQSSCRRIGRRSRGNRGNTPPSLR